MSRRYVRTRSPSHRPYSLSAPAESHLPVSARRPADRLPTSGRADNIGATMLRNCFIFILIFLFPFQVPLQRTKKNHAFIYQIATDRTPDKRQQESLWRLRVLPHNKSAAESARESFLSSSLPDTAATTSAEHAADTHRTYKY